MHDDAIPEISVPTLDLECPWAPSLIILFHCEKFPWISDSKMAEAAGDLKVNHSYEIDESVPHDRNVKGRPKFHGCSYVKPTNKLTM